MSSIVKRWYSWAERLSTASLCYREDFRQAAACLCEETVRELGEFYSVALNEDHLGELNAWMALHKGEVPMNEMEDGIRRLVALFPHIARYWGYRPFTSKLLKPTVLFPATPQWSKLPPELAFLGNPATAFYHLNGASESVRERLTQSVTEADQLWLASIARQVTAVGSKTVSKWYETLGITEHVEAAMVCNLILVIDGLGLPY